MLSMRFAKIESQNSEASAIRECPSRVDSGRPESSAERPVLDYSGRSNDQPERQPSATFRHLSAMMFSSIQSTKSEVARCRYVSHASGIP